MEKRAALILDKVDRIDGLIHLLPLDGYFERAGSVDSDSDSRWINATIKSFFAPKVGPAYAKIRPRQSTASTNLYTALR